MRTILSEKNMVVLLFVMVLITFSLAHEDTKKMEHLYNGANAPAAASADALIGPDIKAISATSVAAIPAVQ